ncbi:beclin 1-associated autophagy-related key regulator-like [Hydractinia symbiolongicarpus]|uniref:beclin 1-associated autophagy-related key regulator-like n=1 Tax=Hydractinia symbiolongicarpus TaxID=13093 RepID=UPI00255006B7|nr:beclin 1-associated autophagy-related key regulator-like [Hydractinia symbiolongicarpus]
MSRPLSVAVESCPLCGRTRKQFTCKSCVNSGNFVTSNGCNKKNSSRRGEEERTKCSYAEKLKRLKVVVAVRDDYHERIVTLLGGKGTENQFEEKVLLQERVKILHIILKEAKSRNEHAKKSTDDLSLKISERKELISRMMTKTERLKSGSRLQEKKEKFLQNKEELHVKNEELKRVRISHVQALITDIFPLSKRDVYPAFGTPPRTTVTVEEFMGDVISESLSTTEKELEEATRTVHVGGRWISQNSVETEHTIIDVGMPSTADFIMYFEWLKSYRNEPRNPESQSGLHVYSVLNIPASLLYTSQLTDGLAFFLDVNLPHKIDYPNFGLLAVSRQRLFQTINKLTHNIMHLCFSQLVSPSELDSNDLLKNIQLCASTENSYLGWRGPFETFEYELTDCPFDSDSSAEEVNYDSDNESVSENDDWDQLIDLPPDHRDVQSETPPPSFEQSRDRSLSSSASGLMTSAAASVASALWSWKRQ